MRTKKFIAEALASSKLPAIHLTPTSEKPVNPLDSMFWGECYLPEGEQIPQTSDGEPMRLLAQINFAQIQNCLVFPAKDCSNFGWMIMRIILKIKLMMSRLCGSFTQSAFILSQTQHCSKSQRPNRNQAVCL